MKKLIGGLVVAFLTTAAHATFNDFPNDFELTPKFIMITEKVADCARKEATDNLKEMLRVSKALEVAQGEKHFQAIHVCSSRDKHFTKADKTRSQRDVTCNEYTLCKAICLHTFLQETESIQASVISLMLQHPALIDEKNKYISEKTVESYRHKSREQKYDSGRKVNTCEAKEYKNYFIYHEGKAYTLCDMCKVSKSNDGLQTLRQLNISFINELASIIGLPKE